jgi:hypothetical protein
VANRLALLALVLACAGCVCPTGPTPLTSNQPSSIILPIPAPDPLIEYRAFGIGSASVRYENEFGHIEDVGIVRLPWSVSHTRLWGRGAVIVAGQEAGCLTVQIWRGGVLVDQHTECAAYPFVALSQGWF